MATGRVCDREDILVPPVTWRRQHADPPPANFQPVHQLADALNGSRVMAIIQDDAEGVFIKHVHAAWGLEYGRVEGAQAMADIVQ